jgi:hypothetical protein
MGRTLKLLRAVQLCMLASILLYGLVGEISGPTLRAVNPSLNYAFATAAVALVGTILVVRRTLVQRAAESLALRPEDPLSLGHWKTGYLATYILCEALALFGLVLRFMGSDLRQSLPFYLGGFVLLFFFAPRQPAKAAAV